MILCQIYPVNRQEYSKTLFGGFCSVLTTPRRSNVPPADHFIATPVLHHVWWNTD